MATHSVRYPATDIFDAPDDGNRWEVIDGTLVVTPPPGWAHQRASGRLFGILFLHVDANDLGELVAAPTGVPHYWIVSPAERTLEAYILGPGGYDLTGTFGPGSTFHPVRYPSLAIEIDRLWK